MNFDELIISKDAIIKAKVKSIINFKNTICEKFLIEYRIYHILY
jgi:hypothetical protein